MTAPVLQAAIRSPQATNVLSGAIEMPFVTLDSLPAVVRTLALSGAVVVVSHDERCQRLTFHRQKTRITRGESPGDKTEEDDQIPGDDRDEDRTGKPPAGTSPKTADSRPSPTASDSEWAGPGDYEEEGSDRTSRGFLWVGGQNWWTAEITVPMHGDGSALLKIERRSTGPVLGPEDAEFVVPPGEADDLLALLAGLFAQARRDGVLTDATETTEPHLVTEDEPTGE